MIFRFTDQEKETLREIERRYYEERAQASGDSDRSPLQIRIKYAQDFQKALRKIELSHYVALQGKPELILQDAQERAEDALYFAADWISNELFIADKEQGKEAPKEQKEPGTFLVNLVSSPGKAGVHIVQDVTSWDWDRFRGMSEQLKDNIAFPADTAGEWIRKEIVSDHISALGKSRAGKKLAQFIEDLLDRLPFVKAQEGVGDPGAAGLPAEEKTQSDNVIYKNYFPVIYGALVDSLVHLDPETRTYDEYTNNTEMRNFANSITVLLQDVNLGKGRSLINPHKLLMLAVGEFTRLNSRNVVTVAVPVDEVLQAMQYNVENKNTYKAARKRLKKDLEILHALRVSGSEKINNQKEDFSLLNIFEYVSIKDGYILFEFSAKTRAILREYTAVNYYHTGLLSISARQETAYKIGNKMFTHFNMNNNQVMETADRLRVSTLLTASGLPTIDDLRNENDSRHWERRIKDPFEKALDELTGKLLKDWEYVKPKGIKLTDEEAANITDYETFSNLLVHFEFTEAPDHTERLERREIKKIENLKRKEEKAEAKKKKKRE